MRRLALICLLLSGCFDPGPSAVGWDGGPACANNSPPAVGNVELNSVLIPEEDQPGDDDDGADDDDSAAPVRFYSLSIHFDWVDPGVSGAEDPPNLVGGGHFSSEILGQNTPDLGFTRANLVDACSAPSTEADPNPCGAYAHGGAGCSSPDAVDTCTTGEFTVLVGAEGLGFPNNELVELEFRIRDACGATSNTKSATYQPGQGLVVEDAGEDGE